MFFCGEDNSISPSSNVTCYFSRLKNDSLNKTWGWLRIVILYSFCLSKFHVPFFSFLNFLPVGYTLIKWEAVKTVGGGKTPVNILDPRFPNAGVLTLVETFCFHVTHSSPWLEPASGDWQLTQGQKGLFWEYLQNFQHLSGTTLDILNNIGFEIWGHINLLFGSQCFPLCFLVVCKDCSFKRG